MKPASFDLCYHTVVVREYFTLRFRHPVALLLLIPAWRYLSRWYLYLDPSDYALFALFFTASILLASLFLLKQLLARATTKRLLLVLAIFLLGLPWCEWMRTSSILGRQDWTKQVFINFLFLYAAALALKIMWPLKDLLAQKADSLLEKLSSRTWLLFFPTLVFLLLTSWIAVFFYKETPFIQDTASHLFQARIFSAGKIFASAPSPEQSFWVTGDMLVIHKGRWFTQYFPGFALLLAVAMKFSAEWLLSPFLGAISIAIWIAYAQKWHGRQTAMLLGASCLFSPFLVHMSSTIMVHTAELFLASALIYLCRKESEEKSAPFRVIVISFLILLTVLVRPFSLMPLLSPVLLYALWKDLKKREWSLLAGSVTGFSLGAALLYYYHLQTTGDPLVSAYVLENPGFRYGFGPNLFGTIHTPLRGLENISSNILAANAYFTGTYAGCLFFLVTAIFLIPRFHDFDALFLLSSLLLVTQYFFVPSPGMQMGPRFLYPLTPICLLFITRGITESKNEATRKMIYSLFLVFFLTALPGGFKSVVAKHGFLQNQDTSLKKEMQANDGKLLVLIDKRCRQTFVNWNDPFLSSPTVLATDQPKWNEQLRKSFPDYRPVYFRLQTGLKKGMLKSGYHFYTEADNRPKGYISLFEVGMIIETMNGSPDRDIFDEFYTNAIFPDFAEDHLNYLDSLPLRQEELEYRKNFRRSLIEVTKLLLSFLKAYEVKQENWREALDLKSIRTHLQNALAASAAAGQTGKRIRFEVEKVVRRIDIDHDSILSDQEILNFLQSRIEYVQMLYAYQNDFRSG